MADKPILFSGPMVRAILDGRKSQTRRLLSTAKGEMSSPPYEADGSALFVQFLGNDGMPMQPLHLRYRVGDRLYVREAWSGIHAFRNTPPAQRESVMTPGGPLLREDVWFWADGNPESGDYEKPRPAMHMPRWASRLTLTVADVRVERTLDISEADAIAEGVYAASVTGGRVLSWLPAEELRSRFYEDPRQAYWALLDHLHGDGFSVSNPWLAAYSFTHQRGNIDNL